MTDTGYTIYTPDLPFFLEHVSPFALGSITDPQLLFQFGLLLAQKAKEVDAHACVIGYSQVLSEEIKTIQGHFDETIAPFFASSAFKASQTIEWIANGLTAGGIFPVLSAEYGISDALIQNLDYRNIFPAILTESDTGEKQTFIEMELAIIDDTGRIPYYPNLLKRLDWSWSHPLKDEETLRRELLIAAITRLKKQFPLKTFEIFHTPLSEMINDRSVVFVRDPRIISLNQFSAGYLIHSTEDFMLERIRLICAEIYFARGIKNW